MLGLLSMPVMLLAAAAGIGAFRTPSGNIVCQHFVAATASVECGIRSGLAGVRPARNCTAGDPITSRVALPALGRAQRVLCAGDPGPFLARTPPVLRYGTTWRGGGISCSSARTGLTCRNRAGHGFFLSRERWRVF